VRRNSDDDEHPFDSTPDDIDQMLRTMAGDATDRVDVHEYDDRISVVADIPGIEESDIDIQCDGRTLAIRISAASRPVVMRVDLPAYVDDQSVRTSYNNGVLEVTFDRGRDPANIGFQ
jgi:HSP20 family protein